MYVLNQNETVTCDSERDLFASAKLLVKIQILRSSVNKIIRRYDLEK